MVFTRNVDVKQCGEKNCRSLSGNTLLSFRDNARGRSTISRPLKRQQSPAAAASAKHPDILFSMASEFNDVLVLEACLPSPFKDFVVRIGYGAILISYYMQFPQPFPGFPPLAGSRALMIDQNRESPVLLCLFLLAVTPISDISQRISDAGDIHSVYREDQVLLGKEFYWQVSTLP